MWIALAALALSCGREGMVITHSRACASEPGSPTDVSGERRIWPGQWTDERGCRVQPDIVRTFEWTMAGHCDWSGTSQVLLGWPQGDEFDGSDRMYTRDPRGVFRNAAVQRGLEIDADVPANARDTGYRQGDKQLWMSAKGDFIYLVGLEGTERWPRHEPRPGCF